MNEKNNSSANSWTIWLAGIVFACFIGVFSFMGNTVKANEDKRVEEDIKIRTEYKEADEKNSIRTEQKIEQEVSKIEKKIDDIRVEQTAQKVSTAEILTMLKQVYKEVKN